MKFLLILLLSLRLMAIDYKIVPTLSSNPTSGTGIGAMSSIIYHADKESSPSQALIIASYTNSGSYNAFGINNMFFDKDNYVSNTIAGYVYNNSEFDLSADVPDGIVLPESNANFQTKALILNQQLLYRFFNYFYIGPQLFYIKQSFDSKNDLGTAFLIANGIEDSSLGSIGLVANFDTRSKTQKLYPRDATNATFTLNYSPESFGNAEDFTTFEIDYRKYIYGFKRDDVLATQLYLKTSSENTPDGSLSALGLKNVLRGFSIGQYKARNLAAVQSEYRYELSDTN